jgi:uncharacterized protein YecT (DUF1311 family)
MFALIAAILLTQTPDAPVNCAQAMTTPQINACAAQRLEAETARMETYLSAARRRAVTQDEETAASSQRAYLDNAQSAWTAYADIVCDGVYDNWSGGTIRTVMALECRIQMTRERTHVIWRDFLTYADSTPPVLPEPTAPVAQ